MITKPSEYEEYIEDLKGNIITDIQALVGEKRVSLNNYNQPMVDIIENVERSEVNEIYLHKDHGGLVFVVEDAEDGSEIERHEDDVEDINDFLTIYQSVYESVYGQK